MGSKQGSESLISETLNALRCRSPSARTCVGLFSYSHTPRCLPASSGPRADCASDIQYCIFRSRQLLFIKFTSSLWNCPASRKVDYPAPTWLYSALMSQRLDPPAKDGVPTLVQMLTGWEMSRKELQAGQSGWRTCPGKREGRSQGDLPAVQESWLWENGAGMRWVFGRAGQHTEKSRWWKQALR